MSKQIRISDVQFDEIGEMSKELGMKKAEILNVAISILKTMRNHKATGFKIINKDKEVEMILPMDMSR